MTEASVQRACLHEETTIQDGFRVCKQCGMVLEEKADLRTSIPFREQYQRFSAGTQHAISRKRQIGTKHERSTQKLRFLHHIDKKETHEERIRREAWHEARRLLTASNILPKHADSITKRALKYYSQIKKYTKFRSARLLVPAAFYFEMRERRIEPDVKTLEERARMTRKEFHEVLLTIIRHNPELNKFRGDQYRKQRVLKLMQGLMEHFHLSTVFMERARLALKMLWPRLKHLKDESVAGILYKTVHYTPTQKDVASHLGIADSVISRRSTKDVPSKIRDLFSMRELDLSVPEKKREKRKRPRFKGLKEEEVRRLYHGQKLSIKKTSEEVGCCTRTLHEFMKEKHIPRRKPGPIPKRKSGGDTKNA